jgi:hypothetical protein
VSETGRKTPVQVTTASETHDELNISSFPNDYFLQNFYVIEIKEKSFYIACE